MQDKPHAVSPPSSTSGIPTALFAFSLLYGGLVVLAGVLGTKIAALGHWPLVGDLAVPAHYRAVAGFRVRSFSLARHSHGGVGDLSAHRPRGAARASCPAAPALTTYTTWQSIARCRSPCEITNATKGDGQTDRRRRTSE
jgi:hypothetical protein